MPVDAVAEDDPVLLPPPEQQGWIIEQMAQLVERTGYEHLVLAPVLEPTGVFFPDRWSGGPPSLRRLLRRLLVYADIDESQVVLVVHDDADVGGPVEPAGPGALVWLVRRQGSTLHFAARASVLRDPTQVVPAAARAVAEAWRAHHALTVSDLSLEQRLVDLATIHLGFGMLTTDASIRHSATRDGGFRVQRSRSRLGVLSPQAMAFALAIQAEARGLSKDARKAIIRSLQANQAGFFRAAVERLGQRGVPVADTLHIPPREGWAEPPAIEGLTAPLPDDDEPDEATQTEQPPDEDRGVLGLNASRPVFRVERTKATRLAKMLGLPAVLLGVLFNRMQMGIEVEMWQAGLLGACLALAGLLIGRFIPDIRCSEPKCGTPLTPDTKTCPRCRGTIAGVIHHPRERLAAEERLTPEDARP